jgi:hypothetical protein
VDTKTAAGLRIDINPAMAYPTCRPADRNIAVVVGSSSSSVPDRFEGEHVIFAQQIRQHRALSALGQPLRAASAETGIGFR